MTTGNSAQTRPRGPWWAWLCLVFGVVLAVAAGGALLGVNALVDRYTRNVKTDDLLGDARKHNNGRVALDGPLNILLLGSDYRRKQGGNNWRADTIMMLHVPRTHDKAYLISFQRDLYVDIPASDNGRWNGGKDKLNSAFAHGGNGAGGYRLLARTLSNLMDIKFDSGMVIDFYGFIKLVDVLGGVEMCVEAPKGADSFKSIHKPYRTFKKGCQRLAGKKALDYIRQRKQFAEGDYARMKHQQQFLKAIVQQARSQNLHRDLGKLDQVIRAGGDSLTIDNSVPVADLAFTLRRIQPEDLTAITVPTAGRNTGVWISEVVDPGPSLFAAIRDDTLDRWVIEHPKHVNPLT